MADSSIPITGGSGYNVDTHTTTNGDHRQVVAMGDATSDSAAKVGTGGDQSVSLTNPESAMFGFAARISAFGEVSVTGTPTTLLQDVFETATVDTTALWSTSGTITPIQSGGNLQLSPGTANSASSIIVSQQSFAPSGMGFTLGGWLVNLESAQQTNPNVHRFWGLGQVTSYTATTPVTDGAGWEVALDGSLQCVVYVGGTKYVINSTTAANISSSVLGAGGSGTPVPALAEASNFGQVLPWSPIFAGAMEFRPEAVFWYLGSQNVPVAYCRYLTPNVSTLPMRMAAITKPAVATVLSTTFNVASCIIGDTGAGNTTLSDGAYPWRKASVGKYGGLKISGATITPTTGALAAATTGTIGPADVSEAGRINFLVKSTTPAVPYTGAPVLVFEESDDGVSWAPLSVVSSETSFAGSTHTLAAGIANGSVVFAAGMAGINWVRVRVTTGTVANGITVVIQPSGAAFTNRVSNVPPSDVRSLSQSIAATSGNAVTSTTLNGHAQAAVQVSGTWTGTLSFEGSIDGSTWTALSAVQVGSSNRNTTTTTANGLWHVAVAGMSGVRVRCSTTGTGSAVIGLSSTTSDSPPDSLSQWRADSVQRVAAEPTAVFTDSFETLDTTDKWITGGTTAPTVSLGAASMNTGTAALARSYMRTIPTFPLYSSAFQRVAMIVALEAAVLTGNKAWWGLGIPNTTPTVASPITNGVVFEILDTDGALYGAVYSGGTRVQSVALVRPTDAGQHRYNIFSQTSRLYFEIDNIVVGSIALPNTQVGSLPLTIGSVNGASILGTARTLTATIFGLADTGRNAMQIADGTFQWRKAQIGESGGLAVRGAQIAPSSSAILAATPATAGPTDVSEAGNITFVVRSTIPGTPYTGAPVLVFEQSDDNTSWAALAVVRSDTQVSLSTHVLPAGVANTAIMFNAPAPGSQFVRVRVTTAPAANGMTIATIPGGMPFQPMVTASNPVRSPVTYYMLIPVATSATDTLQALTGTKSGATVGAATTPAVVTTGKTFRVTSFCASYIATATAGHAMVRLRANTAGLVTIGSPIYRVLQVGAGTPATGNSSTGSQVAAIPDGLEFPTGTGVGISVQGFNGATAAAVGLVVAELSGYEY